MCHSADHTKPKCPLLLSGEIVLSEEEMLGQREVQVDEEDIPKDHIIIAEALPPHKEPEVVMEVEVPVIVVPEPEHHEEIIMSPEPPQPPPTEVDISNVPPPTTPAHNLITQQHSVPTPSSAGGGRPAQKRSKKDWNCDPNRLIGQHFPVTEYETKLEYKVTPDGKIPSGKQRNLNRGYCVICTHKSTVYCKTCHVYLCVKAKVGHENCFYNFHTKADILDCVSGMVGPTETLIVQGEV